MVHDPRLPPRDAAAVPSIFPEAIRKRQAARLDRALAKAAADALRPPPVLPSILPEPLCTRQRDKLRRAVARAMADGLSGKIQPPAEAPQHDH